MTAVFVDVSCPHVPTLCRKVQRNQKLISEGTAIQTERSFVVQREISARPCRSSASPVYAWISNVASWVDGSYFVRLIRIFVLLAVMSSAND